MPHNTSK